MSYSGPFRVTTEKPHWIDSYGRGAAYAFYQEQPDGSTRSVFVQGDEAHVFSSDLESVTNGQKFLGGKTPLAWLWDECGWGDAAQADDPTWDHPAVKGWRDSAGGIVIKHEDGSSGYVEPGANADSLADTLDQCKAAGDGDNLAALLCDFISEIPDDDQ